MQFVNLATQMPGARLTPLHQAIKLADSKFPKHHIPINAELRSCLLRWHSQYLHENFQSPSRSRLTHIGALDASDTGLGFILSTTSHPTIHRTFTKPLSYKQHISVSELQAFLHMVKALPSNASALFTDNQAILGMLKNGHTDEHECRVQ